MSIAHDKVYLVTNVAYPGHFLTILPGYGSKVIASATYVNCWHLKHDTDKDEWVMNPISSPVKHQLVYHDPNTYSLKIDAEDNGPAYIYGEEFKLKLTAMDNASFTGNYEISTSKDDSTWLAAIRQKYLGMDSFPVLALTRDDTKPGNQQWKFLKMPA